jgi:hypothetical protein
VVDIEGAKQRNVFAYGSFAPSFGQWLFITGTVFILGGLFLLGKFMRISHHEESGDIHILYRQR